MNKIRKIFKIKNKNTTYTFKELLIVTIFVTLIVSTITGIVVYKVISSNELIKLESSYNKIKNEYYSDINKEEEVELNIMANEYDNLIFIVKNVLHMNEVESYERYRTTYSNNEIEIALDEYPFGLAVEIEAKKEENSENIVRKYVDMLNLDANRKYRLSWDDKYEELCKDQNIEHFNHVAFNKEMPEVK